MRQKSYKYRINELLRKKLPLDYFNVVVDELLPKELNISKGTFRNYRAIEINDPQDIPHTVVAKLEMLFEIEPGKLQNFNIEMPTIEKVLEAAV